MSEKTEIKDFLTEAFLRYGREVPHTAAGVLEYGFVPFSITELERLELVLWRHIVGDWFHITDKGMALIGEDNA